MNNGFHNNYNVKKTRSLQAKEEKVRSLPIKFIPYDLTATLG